MSFVTAFASLGSKKYTLSQFDSKVKKDTVLYYAELHLLKHTHTHTHFPLQCVKLAFDPGDDYASRIDDFI